MEANSAKMFATLVVIFLFGVDLAKNDKITYAQAAGATSIRAQIKNEPAVNLEGPNKECTIPLNQTVWYPATNTCETLLAKGKPCFNLFGNFESRVDKILQFNIWVLINISQIYPF